MVKPQVKGADFERAVSKELSLWSSDGKDAFIFNRRSGSGGAGRDKSGDSGSGGDIYADNSEGKWLTDHTMFELKFYKDLTSEFWRFMLGENSMIDDFIAQARESSDVYGRTWSLIFKCNQRKPFFLTNSELIGQVVSNPVCITRKGEVKYLFPYSMFLEEHHQKLRDLIASNNEN